MCIMGYAQVHQARMQDGRLAAIKARQFMGVVLGSCYFQIVLLITLSLNFPDSFLLGLLHILILFLPIPKLRYSISASSK